jgi:hypothetical protein
MDHGLEVLSVDRTFLAGIRFYLIHRHFHQLSCRINFIAAKDFFA